MVSVEELRMDPDKIDRVSAIAEMEVPNFATSLAWPITVGHALGTLLIFWPSHSYWRSTKLKEALAGDPVMAHPKTNQH